MTTEIIRIGAGVPAVAKPRRDLLRPLASWAATLTATVPAAALLAGFLASFFI